MLDVITKRTPKHPYKFQSKITPQNSIQPNEFLPPLYSMIYIFSLRALIIGEKALKNKKWKNFHASVPRFYQRFSRLLNEIKYKKVLFVAPLIMLPFTLISLFILCIIGIQSLFVRRTYSSFLITLLFSIKFNYIR